MTCHAALTHATVVIWVLSPEACQCTFFIPLRKIHFKLLGVKMHPTFMLKIQEGLVIVHFLQCLFQKSIIFSLVTKYLDKASQALNERVGCWSIKHCHQPSLYWSTLFLQSMNHNAKYFSSGFSITNLITLD